MVTLSARGVSVSLGGRRVLDDVSLNVAPGELVAILGPNGSGKTTLLNTLSGELTPDDGEVSLGAAPVRTLPPLALAQIRALMPQRASLTFPFKVRAVVAMGRDPFHAMKDPASDGAAIDWALASTDTEHLADRVYTRLSGGEQQRVQLARVLAQIWRASPDQTAFLLLDEPTSSLDLSHQHATLQVTRGLTERGVGAVAVVHDINLAALYATQVAVLSHGRLVALGTPDETLTQDLITTVFGISVHLVRDPATGRTLIVPMGLSPNDRPYVPLRAAQ